MARWCLGGELVGGETPWWRDDQIPTGNILGQLLSKDISMPWTYMYLMKKPKHLKNEPFI